MDNELYYLRAIRRRLGWFYESLNVEDGEVSMLGLEAMADEMNWLDEQIYQRERAQREEG